MQNNHRIIAGIAIFLLLAAFLWSTQSVLSPFLAGGLLLFILFGIKESRIVRRIAFSVIFIFGVWFLVRAQGVIFPFLIAFILAYLFDPLVDFMEKIHVPRGLSTLLVLLVNLGVFILVGVLLIPGLVREIQDLINRIPDMADKLYVLAQRNLPRLMQFLQIDSAKLHESLLEEIPSRTESVLSNLLKGLTGVGAFLGKMFNIILIPILTFYFLKDFDRIRGFFLDFIPRKYHSRCNFYLWRINRIFGGYIRGQLIVSSIVGILTGIGLALFHIPFAILIGFTAGILNVIPYLGLYISLGIALLAGLFTPNIMASMIKIAGVFLVVQAIEAYFISPKILGDRVGLHPVAVIFSILVFSRFLGFWGLIIAVPTAALLKFFIDELRRHQKFKENLAEKIVVKNNSS